MHKHVYFRVLIEEELTTGECLTRLHYIQSATMQLSKMIRAGGVGGGKGSTVW